MEQIIKQPYDNPVFQAEMITDTKRGQRIDQGETWFHLIVLVAGGL